MSVAFQDGQSAATGAVDIITCNPHVAIDQFYDYSGDVANGNMLVPHTIETEEKYAERKKFSCNVNYLAPTIDAVIRPIFDKKIKRFCENEMVKLFWNNVDCRGSSMDSFMRRSGEEVRKHSTYFIIMDNFPEDEQPKTEADALANRVMPYVYKKKPQDVADYGLDARGAIQYVTFYNGTHKVGDKSYPKFCKIDKDYFTAYYVSVSDKREKTIVIIDEVPHPLGRLPIEVMRDKLPEDGELCAHPRAYNLMRISHSLYNKDSEMRESERKEQFSMLAIEMVDGTVPAHIAVGTSNTMYYGKGAKTPAFVEPSPGILAGLLATKQSLRDDFFMVAGQSGVTGVQTAKSGTAMAFEFMGKESSIREYADICEVADRAITQMFCDWIDAADDFVIEYPDSYTPADDAAQYKWADIVLMNRESLPASVVSDATMLIASKLRPSMTDEDAADMAEEIRLFADGESKISVDLTDEEAIDAE